MNEPIWRIAFDSRADHDLEKLDHSIKLRIRDFLKKRVAWLEDPRSIGEALRGSELGDCWRYRVGDYRIIVHIQDEDIVVFVVKIGHRREIYR